MTGHVVSSQFSSVTYNRLQAGCYPTIDSIVKEHELRLHPSRRYWVPTFLLIKRMFSGSIPAHCKRVEVDLGFQCDQGIAQRCQLRGAVMKIKESGVALAKHGGSLGRWLMTVFSQTGGGGSIFRGAHKLISPNPQKTLDRVLGSKRQTSPHLPGWLARVFSIL